MIRDLLQDLRYALRSSRKSPGFFAVVTLSLALGIGANAAIFSLVNAVLLRPLPVREPDRLVLFSDGLFDGYRSSALGAGRVPAYSYPLYDRLRTDSRGQGNFVGIAAQQANRTRAVVRWEGESADGAPVAAAGRLVSGNYFEVLGVSAIRGRTFGAGDETAPGANPVVVLSHEFWQRRFGGAATLLGSRLTINGRPYTVVGVAAPDFTGTRLGDRTDFWVPLSMQAELMRSAPLFRKADDFWLLVYGRLEPRASLKVAAASVNLSLQRWLAETPAAAQDQLRPQVRIELQSGAQGGSTWREDSRRPLLVLMGGVVLLLLIVCLNLSHLLLARAATRQREMSIRTAMGASSARLVRQLLAESLLLAAAGGLAAVLTTRWMIDGLLALVAPPGPGGGAGALEVTVDYPLLAFIATLSLGTAFVLGLVPAWQASRSTVQQVLGAASRSVVGAGSRRLLSRLLLASQVAFSVVLLVGAGLLMGTLQRLRQQDLGFDHRHILQSQLMLQETGLTKDEALRLYDDLLGRVRALPGVERASMSLGTGGLMRAATWSSDIYLGAARSGLDALSGTVTPDYFATLGIPILRGRELGPQDRAGAPQVAVVNESFARKAFGGLEAALGQRFSFDEKEALDIEIVGVARDTRSMYVRKQPSPALYRPVAQAPDFLWSLEVRVHGDPAPLVEQIRRTVRETHPALTTPLVRRLSDHVERSLGQERTLATLSTVFGCLALFLVSIGLYGVIAQWTAQRTREIGVRMALGATAGGLRWLVLRQAFALVLAGLVVGVPAALGASRVLEGILYGLPPVHPPTLALVVFTLLVVASLAAYLPARRASRVDPMQALRAE